LRGNERKVEIIKKKMASHDAQRPQPPTQRIVPINHRTVVQLVNMGNELKRILTAAERAVEQRRRQDRRRTRTVEEEEAEDRAPLQTRFLEDVEAKIRAAHEAVEDALLTAQIFEAVEGTEVLPISVDEW
jgi:putative protein kinase ArgK-like GTPase of G3E family